MKKIMCLVIASFLNSASIIYPFTNKSSMSTYVKLDKLSEARKNVVYIKAKEIKYKEEGLELNFKIPVVQGMKDKLVQKKINNMLQEDVMDFKKDLEDEAKKNLEYSKKNILKIKPHIGRAEYEINHNKGNILSVSIIYHSHTEGTKETTEKKSFNIDLETGNEARLKDLFYDGENYKDIISKEIKKQISERIEKGQDKYFEGSIDKINFISDNQAFYIKDENIVICYAQYEIVPYSFDIKEFKIPSSIFNKGIKKYINVKYPPVKVKTKKVISKDDIFTSDLKIPIIEGIRNKDLQENLNKEYKDNIINFKRKAEKAAVEHRKKVKKEGGKIIAYDAVVDFNVNYNENDLLSISVMYYQYKGIDDGEYKKSTENINLKTGKLIVLKDIFKDRVDYKDIINKEIKNQIKNNIKNLKEEKKKEGLKYYDIYEPYKKFKSISDNQSFFINNGNIVIYFGVDEIGECSEETPEFKIPISKIKENVKEEFLHI